MSPSVYSRNRSRGAVRRRSSTESGSSMPNNVPRRADRLDGPVGSAQQWLRVAAERQFDAIRAVGQRRDEGEAHGAERRRQSGRAGPGAQPARRRPATWNGGPRTRKVCRASPVERGGLDPLAADVADGDGPAVVVDLERVVEVATDEVRRPGRPVAGRDRYPSRGVEVLRHQAQLECFGDLALLVVQALVLVGQRHRRVVAFEQPCRSAHRTLPQR